jgi:DNA invertase Pin-like site-specific DNA recombinase
MPHSGRGLEAGDTLIVSRLDRLARSTRDLLNILHALAEKGAKFKSLHDAWCDTSTSLEHLRQLDAIRLGPADFFGEHLRASGRQQLHLLRGPGLPGADPPISAHPLPLPAVRTIAPSPSGVDLLAQKRFKPLTAGNVG